MPASSSRLGLIVGAGTLFWLGQLNLSAGYWDIFWPQFLQGIGLSLVFVPLTTISMDPIPRERMGNATSLFNLMRNLGGSIGIAVTGTLLARRTHVYASMLGEHVTAYSETSRHPSKTLRQGFIAGGSDPVTATQRAYAALQGIVQRQATMVSFVDLFRDARHHLPGAPAAGAADEAAQGPGPGRGALRPLGPCRRPHSDSARAPARRKIVGR